MESYLDIKDCTKVFQLMEDTKKERLIAVFNYSTEAIDYLKYLSKQYMKDKLTFHFKAYNNAWNKPYEVFSETRLKKVRRKYHG